ncbi:MAG TPA: PQQ-binding-like beta-propeller repeat protein [Phycisphaerae bacterium]|nr:PQQ-binding-like beta-propeller repeat protein [Phycisphaerae bacterium]HOB73352.1 PQQ-binding-like beta-propeller repeat protein [Phycisphaerae bacterium]HOJ55213.1 PQQ-binding-like beta-propeller repeat protein [Phycisphaerae bacterium]HOL24994.1 PQQ-binding-like beta-propeller repeat protein [Phycisphaerae bacterium]HPP20096.1 PQQ-binding-like beta-propeller repeat protein [Phycisphaerae bacterium]
MNLLLSLARSRRVAACGALAVAACTFWPVGPEVVAQQVVRRPVLGGRTGRDARQANPFAAVLHPSEEATTLMARARQGIEREDWKLVVDSLQRIVELPGEHVLTSDGRVYEAARRQAQRRIATLPPAGLAAYRLMYDSEAAALLAKAADQHDLALLQSVVDRYLVTKVGDEAGAMLADWLIDEGRFAEAVAVLQLIESIYPDSDLPPWVLPGKLAVCYAGMGRRQRAEAALKEVVASRPAETRPGEALKADEPSVARTRLDLIRAYAERPLKGEETPDAAGWTVAYGRPSRDGIMPPVDPSLVENLPWAVPLSLSDELSGVVEYARKRKLLPTAQMVAGDRLLIVKSGPVLQAIDLDTFEVHWCRKPGSVKDDPAIIEAPVGGAGGWAQVQSVRESAEHLDSNAVVRQLLRDSVSSGLSLVSGLVLTLEWLGDPPTVTGFEQIRAWPGAGGLATTYPNRVVAYSLKDGAQVWESNTRPGENKLGLVEFLAAPIPVDGYLVAPCRVNTDLYAAVLDPATGQLVRHVYLCGTGGGPFNSLYALLPCVADGVVYIPTGRGVLIALEASSWSIRWAVRYDHLSERTTESAWLPTPVIAAADSVLLAPPDANHLFCLDRATGEIRWQVERGQSSYVLGANDRYAWLGGEQVQLVDVETGKVLWRKSVAEPSGRGVVAGDRLYLPTVSGLMALNALTGAVIELASPAESLVLGNLLVFHNTLYSTDTAGTREFPDMQRGYAEALQRHQAKPAEPTHAIRLARLELLRHSPARALAALEKIPESLKAENLRRYQQVNHLRVTAMLELAASGEVSSEQARRLLEEARRIALSPQDAVDSALALGEYHRRENRPLEACQQYLLLVLSREGDQMVCEGDEFRQRARGVAVRKLADAARALDAAGKAKLEESIRQALREAESDRNGDVMLWLAESPALGAVADQAALILGRWAMEELRFEQAEGYFNQVIRRASSPATEAEAAARLAALYLLPDELHLPVSALKLLERLEHEFASVEVPADVLAIAGVETVATRPAAPEERRSGAIVARELRQRVNRTVLARHQAALGAIRLGPPGEPSTSLVRGARPLLVRDDGIEPLVNQHLVLLEGKKIEARGVEDGRVLWPAELRLLNELAVESRVDAMVAEQRRLYGPAPGPGIPARGVTDGQTLILNSAYGIHAIGLLTGRRLWSRQFDPPVVRPQQERSASDAWLWVHDGYVISVNKGGDLEVSLTTSGDRLLWSHRRPGRRWYAVRARGPYVVAVDDQLEQVDVFRLEDGRYLGACHFKQGAAYKMNIALFEDVICGPASENEVAALELATPGVERWRVSAVSDLAQLFKPSADLLAVADQVGRVQLVDPRTGRRHMAPVRVQACAEGVMAGTLEDGVLYVCGFKKRASGAADADQQRWGLAAIRVADATVLWSRDDLGPRTHLNQEVLGSAVNVIPVAVLTTANERPRQFQAGRPRTDRSAWLELTLLDKATGQKVGESISAPVDPEAGAARVLSVRVRPGEVQVTVGEAWMRFPTGSGVGQAATRPADDESSPAGIDVGESRAGGMK